MALSGEGSGAARRGRLHVRGIQHWLKSRDGRVFFPLTVALVVLSGFRNMAFRLTTHTIGRNTQYSFDADAHIWQYWWAWRRLRGGEPVLETSYMTHPFVADLKSMWGGHLDLVLGLPLMGLLGPVGVANVVMAVMLTGCALGVYLLAAAVSGSRLGGAVAALLYVLTPNVLWELRHGRVEEFACGFVALSILFAGRFLTDGRWRQLAAALFWLFVSGLAWLGSLLLMAFLLPPLALGYLVWMRRYGGRGDSEWASPCPDALSRRLLLLFGSLAVLAAPVILFGLFEVGSHWAVDAEVTGMAERARAQWLLSILDTKVPLSRMFGWSSMLPHSGPGLVMGLAAALGLVAPAALRWRTLPWALGAVLFMVLAMGPTMIALPDGGVTAFPHDPLAAVVPFLRRFHYANRFMLMGGVCLAVMAAVGVAGLVRFLERCCGWRMAGIFPAILLLLLALQQVSLLFPVTVGPMSLEVTRFYEGLERREGQGILVLHDGEEGSSTLVAQMEHEIPYCCLSMPDGMRPDGMEEAQKRSPLFTFLSQNLHPNLSPMCPSGTMRRQRLERLGLYDGAVAEVDSWRGRFEDRVAEGSEEFQALLDDDPALLGQMGYSHVVVVVGRTGMRGPDVIRYWAALHAILRHHFGEPVVSGEETGATYAAYEIPRDGAE